MTARDFEQAVVSYAEALSVQHVIYAELHFTPWNHVSRGIDWTVFERGLLTGIAIAERRHRIRLKLIPDLRRTSDEDWRSVIAWMVGLPRTIAVALGVSGGPHSVPLQFYGDLSEYAHEQGFRVVVHAGELEGPESVRVALGVLHADRICHGVRILEDPQLLDSAIRANVHFELCPTSNRLLRIGQPDYLSIATLLKLNAWCSVNTDDELMFGTDICQELRLLLAAGMIHAEDVPWLQLEAARAAFCGNAEKAELLSMLLAEMGLSALAKEP